MEVTCQLQKRLVPGRTWHKKEGGKEGSRAQSTAKNTAYKLYDASKAVEKGVGSTLQEYSTGPNRPLQPRASRRRKRRRGTRAGACLSIPLLEVNSIWHDTVWVCVSVLEKVIPWYYTVKDLIWKVSLG